MRIGTVAFEAANHEQEVGQMARAFANNPVAGGRDIGKQPIVEAARRHRFAGPFLYRKPLACQGRPA
jgi:hypothetical protein